MKRNQKQSVLDTVPIPGSAPADAADAKKPGPLKEAEAAFHHLLEQQEEQARLNAGGLPKALLPEDGEDDKAAASEEKPEAKEKPSKEARELERLRAKLQLASVPERVVKTLSDEEVREMWSGMEDRERASALALQRASDSEKRLQEATSKKAEPVRVPTAELDLDEIHSELQETFGTDEAGALMRAIQKLVGKEIEPMRQDTASFKRMLEEAKQLGTKSVAKSNLDRLAEKLPSLKTNQRAREVLEAQVVAAYEKDPSKYSSAEAAFDDVFEALYGDMLDSADTATTRSAKEKSRIGASALSQPAARRSDRKPTHMEAAFSAFQALSKNPEDLDGARAAYGRALNPQ